MELSVIVTVVSGKRSVFENLTALCPQVHFESAEVIVPYDKWSMDVSELVPEFPDVRFVFIDDIDTETCPKTTSRSHRHYDRRRAVGLRAARGKIVVMTEDHALPAEDWIEQMMIAHERPYDVVGGAVENGIDRPLNRALYYCDFGRYGRPFKSGNAAYASDVNLAYKREALDATRSLWSDGYQETTVNWELQKLGKKIHLDDAPVVYQRRPPISVLDLIMERIEWGRVFAGTRKSELQPLQGLIFAIGTVVLPPLLFFRAIGHMRRQKQNAGAILSTMPVLGLLVVFWSFGEFLGYIGRKPKSMDKAIEDTGKSALGAVN